MAFAKKLPLLLLLLFVINAAAIAAAEEEDEDDGENDEDEPAKEEGKKVRGIWAYSDDRTNLDGVATVTWSDANISNFIDSL